jgi:ribonuclease HI
MIIGGTTGYAMAILFQTKGLLVGGIWSLLAWIAVFYILQRQVIGGIKMSDIFIDGSGWNGKEAKFFVMSDDALLQHFEIIKENKTNNQMEYESLRYALLNFAKDGDTIYTDSKLVLGQVCQNWKINVEHLRGVCEECKELLKIKNIYLKWIPRDKNLAGIYIEIKSKKDRNGK